MSALPAGNCRPAERVFYAYRIARPELPSVTFGLMMAVRSPAHELTGSWATNEVAGSDRSPGFHAIQKADGAAPGDVTLFGYYAGNAATITATVGGNAVEARMSRWSVDRNVAVFWFTKEQLAADAAPSQFVARDTAGTVLPAGNTAVGHG